MRLGFTFDRMDRFDSIIRFVRSCRKRPVLRLICDPPWAGFVYDQLREPCRILSQDADIMLCLADSTAVAKFSLADYADRARKAIAQYNKWVKWVEVGNEVGGPWLGELKDVEEKVTAAFNIAREAGKKTAITWLHSGSSPNTMAGVVHRITVPADLQLVSYYPNWSPSDYEPDWQQLFGLLSVKYSKALVGIGEFGPEPMVKTPPHRAKLIRDFYRTVTYRPERFFGGYFYWDTWQDACGHKESQVVMALQSGFTNPMVTG